VPVIVGAANAVAGWMSVCDGGDAPCYTCLTRQCGGAGAGEASLGTVAAGFIGTLLAAEAIKIVLGLRPRAGGQRVTFDALRGDVRIEPALPDPHCAGCRGRARQEEGMP
jgi:sulfur-carrier protein adenylyltransferase/sulfurtransferase